jgi:hypothetical protein
MSTESIGGALSAEELGEALSGGNWTVVETDPRWEEENRLRAIEDENVRRRTAMKNPIIAFIHWVYQSEWHKQTKAER